MAVSVLLFTMVCTAVPARADVNITATQGSGTYEVIISYESYEANLVRAFAFDIWLCSDANIISVTALSADYYIYPGSIQVDASGNVIDYGTAVAEYNDLPNGTLSGLDSNGITIEMASLYAPVGPGSPNAPAHSGDLLSIILSGPTCMKIAPNVARAGNTGVVMENPNEVVTVNYPYSCCDQPPPPPCTRYNCMKYSAPEYPEWDAWDKPQCWCYGRQCRGDSDGIKTGPFWVAIPDLNAFRAAFNKSDLVLQTVTNGICSDFDHMKTGPFRVGIPDLNIFRTYFNKPELQVPECDKTDYKCWLTP